MTKPKPKPAQAVDAVRIALEREKAKRASTLKPIEVVKIAISAYQAFTGSDDFKAPAVESDDRAGLRRGTQASVDRLLFNVNYWRAAYEDRIVAACPTPDDAHACLQAISSWNTHTMKLNVMPDEEVAASFERFCPPFAMNNRRGEATHAKGGKGPIPDFRAVVRKLSGEGESADDKLQSILQDVEAEAAFYDTYADATALDAFYDLLPAWCLQERIELVNGTWWNDVDVMRLVAEELHAQFVSRGYPAPLCSYFLDAMRESLDGYTREMSSEESPFRMHSIPQLVELVRAARATHPDSETEGYGSALPAWLGPKEQLIWNTIVCAIVPAASCYPEQRIETLRASEVECLAILEHRRWFDERTAAGWKFAPRKNIEVKESPYLVDWDELPDRAREWNRSSIRDIPGLLSSVGLAISR